MKRLLFLIAITNTTHAAGQQHIVTYWDAFHLTKQEDFYLNQNGEMHGKYIAYASDGSVNVIRYYKNGLMNGKETLYYYEYGRRGLSHISNFKDDKFDGLQQAYECSGIYVRFVCKEEFYKNTKLVWRKMYGLSKADKRYLFTEEHFDERERVISYKEYDEKDVLVK